MSPGENSSPMFGFASTMNVGPRAKILAAAVRYLRTKTPGNPSWEELSKALRVPQDELMQHFPSRDALLAAAIARIIAQRASSFYGEDGHRGWAGFEAYLELLKDVHRNRESLGVFLRLRHDAADPSNDAHEVLQELHSLSSGVIERSVTTGIEDGEISTDADPKAIALSFVALADGLEGWRYAGTEVEEVFAALRLQLDLLKCRYGVAQS